jgi:hypothetical protein
MTQRAVVSVLSAHLFGCARGTFLPTALEKEFWGVWGGGEYVSEPILCTEYDGANHLIRFG